MSNVRTDTPAFTALLASPLTRQNRAALEADCLRHFGAEHRGDIAALLDLLLEGEAAGAGKVHADGIDLLYREAILELAQSCPLQDGGAVAPAARRVQSIDRRYDFFYSRRDERAWSLLRFMNFLARGKIQPRRRLAIVTTIRNEGINLIEWIAHHRLLGVDDFIIYVNDNDDGSTELLELLAGHGLIQLIWNETAIGKDGTTNMFPIQAKCFGHASEFLIEARDFEWLLFLDLDEFLITKPVFETPAVERPLDDLFARLAALPRPAAAVAFNWKWFKSLCKYSRQPGLNFERFVYWSGNDHVKTIVRSDRCLSFRTSHIPDLPPRDIVLNGGLEPVEKPGYLIQHDYRYGQINHYFNKSFEEFVGKHLRVWGDRTFEDFFRLGGNRDLGPEERLPAAWLGRVHAEIAAIRGLPGIAEAAATVERGYTELLAAFDRQRGIEALFDQHLAAQ